MSVVETIRGLRKMTVADGAAATPPPSPRSAQKISVAAVVAALGGVDGLRAILMEYWRSDLDGPRAPDGEYLIALEGLEAHNVPKDLSELLTNGIEEALCRGFLDGRNAVDMAVRRAELLIGENITLPVARDKDRVYWLMQNMEEEDWKLMADMMGEPGAAFLEPPDFYYDQ